MRACSCSEPVTADVSGFRETHFAYQLHRLVRSIIEHFAIMQEKLHALTKLTILTTDDLLFNPLSGYSGSGYNDLRYYDEAWNMRYVAAQYICLNRVGSGTN